MKEVVANSTVPLCANVRDIISTPNLPKTSGTIYVVLQLQLPGDGDDGKYWDNNDSTWQASPVAWPTATYKKGSAWSYTVPAAATNGKAGGVIQMLEMTDNVATPASSTVTSYNHESVGVVSAARAVNLTQIDGQATSSNLATLNLKQLNVVNDSGSAIVASSTGSNGKGIYASGNGTGHGLYIYGGSSGHGMFAQGGAGNTIGIYTVGQGTGHGLYALSGAGATGNGIFGESQATNGNGLASTGKGTGHGIRALGGATGHGAKFLGGATSGNGILAQAQNNNDAAIKCTPHGTGLALEAANLATAAAQGTPTALAGGAATLAGMLASIAGSGFVAGDDAHSIKAGVAGTPDAVAAQTAIAASLTTIGTNLDAKISTRAATGGDSDTLETLSDQIDALQLSVEPADIADAVLDAAIADHLDAGSVGAAISAVAVPVGSHSISITVVDPDDEPLAGVDVSIWGYSGGARTAFHKIVTTDENGEIATNLNNGSYVLSPVYVGYTFADPVLLTVDGDEVVIIEATPCTAIGTPTAGNCLVWGYATDGTGTAANGVQISIGAVTPQGVGNNLFVETETTVTSGPTTSHPLWPAGYFEFSLQQSTTQKTRSTLANLDGLVITVPATSTANLSDLVEAVS